MKKEKLTLKKMKGMYEEIEKLTRKSKPEKMKEWIVWNIILPLIPVKKVYNDEPLIEYTEFKCFGGCYYVTGIKWL